MHILSFKAAQHLMMIALIKIKFASCHCSASKGLNSCQCCPVTWVTCFGLPGRRLSHSFLEQQNAACQQDVHSLQMQCLVGNGKLGVQASTQLSTPPVEPTAAWGLPSQWTLCAAVLIRSSGLGGSSGPFSASPLPPTNPVNRSAQQASPPPQVHLRNEQEMYAVAHL